MANAPGGGKVARTQVIGVTRKRSKATIAEDQARGVTHVYGDSAITRLRAYTRMYQALVKTDISLTNQIKATERTLGVVQYGNDTQQISNTPGVRRKGGRRTRGSVHPRRETLSENDVPVSDHQTLGLPQSNSDTHNPFDDGPMSKEVGSYGDHEAQTLTAANPDGTQDHVSCDTLPGVVLGKRSLGKENQVGADIHQQYEAFAEAATRPFKRARQIIREDRKMIEKIIVRLAQQLPVWPWIKDIRGAGALGLGQIIGYAGDLWNYANPAKLWKRMGLGMVDGMIQRRIRAISTPGGTRKQKVEAAHRHGFSPVRRALMHNIGDSLMKLNHGEYRVLYVQHKQYQREKHPDMKLIHAHKRALRYMEKRFLLHLWQEWRKHDPVSG